MHKGGGCQEPPTATYFKVPMHVDQEVLRLQIPVDEVQGMKVLEGENDLCRVEPRMRLAVWRASLLISLGTESRSSTR